jgi:methylenetetrahydrofolate reductase (NADPH)
VITQLFFENQDYFDYVARLRKLGVTKRVIPGIVPITDFTGIVNFCKSCGASIPKKVHDIFEPIKDNKEETLKAGIDYAIRQCRELLDKGAPGIHFYPLNKIHPVDVILPALR